jgi:hypothetical protein
MEPLAVRVEARPDAFHSFPAPQSHLFKDARLHPEAVCRFAKQVR